MPWCPECKTEYRPEIDRCADCGAELVEQEPAADDSRSKLVLQFLGDVVYSAAVWTVCPIPGMTLFLPWFTDGAFWPAVPMLALTFGLMLFFGFVRPRMMSVPAVATGYAIPALLSLGYLSVLCFVDTPPGMNSADRFRLTLAVQTPAVLAYSLVGGWVMTLGNRAGRKREEKHP